MRHLILGNGNLGNALADKLKKEHTVKICSTTNGWKYPSVDLQPIYDFVPDHVWCTVGAGSVEQAKINFLPYVNLHIRLPIEIAQTVNANVTLHFFSSDYATDETKTLPAKSLYQLSKQTMEHGIALLNRPKTYIYRVGSLYGTYKPHKCFPYKIKKNYIEQVKKGNETLYLPINCITPTPTDWLADILIANINTHSNTSKLYNVAPFGCCKVTEWGKLILQDQITIQEKEADPERPFCSNIGCDLPINNVPSWLDLWKEREQKWFDILDKIT
jgi:hypothetical protein